MDDDNKYRVWVGCLACYNDGRLVGEWFDADSCPQDMEEFDASFKRHEGAPSVHGIQLNPHEELWVMDHENSPVDGEYSPMDAAQYAEWLEGVDDPSILKAWLSNGNEFNADTAEEMNEAYAGTFDSDSDFAQNMADELGLMKDDMPWPYTCIDWDHAARELMYDYWEDNHHYFRNM